MARNDTGGFGSPPPRLGPMDIQQKEFRVSRFGGYKMRDVDEFLDELTTSMGAIVAENERLREQAGSAPIVGSPDLDDVGRQADEIIQRARAEADRILADARAGASAARAIGSGSGREAVDAFLLQEREFLQGLAALVQNHAESVKGMARASRDAARQDEDLSDAATDVSPGASTSGAAADAGADADDAADTPATAEASLDDAGSPADATDVAAAEDATDGDAEDDAETTEGSAATAESGTEASPAGEPTIRIDDPQPARAGGDGDADGSLRDLFWGEED